MPPRRRGRSRSSTPCSATSIGRAATCRARRRRSRMSARARRWARPWSCAVSGAPSDRSDRRPHRARLPPTTCIGRSSMASPILCERRSDVAIIFDLATRLGLGAEFWGGDLEAGYRHLLAPSGVSLETLAAMPHGISVPRAPHRYRKFAELDETRGAPRGFATPTKKVEIFALTFAEHGLPALPVYVEPALSPLSRPDLAERFPLVLTNAKRPQYMHSQLRRLPSLRKTAPNPTAEIHPETAAEYGISGGQWIVVETPSGRVRAQAQISDAILPGVVCCSHGWWEACPELGLPGFDPFSEAGANQNLLVTALENEGVQYILGVPGEENLDVVEALRRSSIRLVVTRHEQAAAFMAATHGRLTGRAGVCLSTLGPGALNLTTGAAFALLGAMPMVMLTGQKGILSRKQARFQVVDMVSTMTPLSKMAHQIVSPATIPSIVREAFRVAQQERPGPVHLELPEDIAGVAAPAIPLVTPHPIDMPVAHPAALERAAELILKAERPLVVLGAAANRPRLADALSDFVQRLQIPL